MNGHQKIFEGADQLQLVADCYGDPEDRPVILLHGGGQTRHSWGNTAQKLATAGWFAVSLDLRGHGESAWSPQKDYSLDTMLEDLVAVSKQLGPVKPVLVGASLGGMISLLAEGERSPTASAVVLVDVASRLERPGVERILAFMHAHPKGFSSLEHAAEWVAGYLPGRQKSSNPVGLSKNLREGEDGRWRWKWDPAFLDWASDPAHEQEVPRRLDAAAKSLTVPTLLVRGRMSDVLSEEGARHFLELCPHAEYVDVAGAAHMVAGDRNDPFTSAVIEFFDRLL
jgi:pimeloyl-ACP methyl ester carboxylesterase